MIGTPKKVSLQEAGIVPVEGMKVIARETIYTICADPIWYDEQVTLEIGLEYANDSVEYLETIIISHEGKQIPISPSDLQTILDKDLLGREVEFEMGEWCNGCKLTDRSCGVMGCTGDFHFKGAKLIQPKERLFTLEEVKELGGKIYDLGRDDARESQYEGKYINKLPSFWQQQGLDKD